MFGGHNQDHASCFIQQVTAKIHQERQHRVYGPLEMCPCECRGPVQALVWQIVEGKMGHKGAPKDQKNNQQTDETNGSWKWHTLSWMGPQSLWFCATSIAILGCGLT
jgi:hypothetical protein